MFEKIENKWTEDSGDYDDMIQKQLSNKRTVSYWTKELKRLLGPEPLRILEVGCGPGFMSIIAARLGHDVKAIDGSSGMVEKARRNMRQYHQQVEICEEDGVTLPLEQEQSYDVILSRDAVKENSGIYEKLPFTSQKRPEADFQILKKVRFARIQIRENRWLNRPWTMDFWKYGYQGKKFIVVATKKEK